MPKKLDIPKLLRALNIQAVQRGREWFAKCPNPKHDDRHPSWHIKDSPLSSKHGWHKCHPCGLGGGPAELVRVVYDFAEIGSAVQWLRDFRKGVVEDEPEVDVFRWEMMSLTRRGFVLPPEVVVEPLEQWPSLPRDYVLSRGITPDQVERYGIGYAVFGRLSGRIVFPARGVDGEPRNYTARTFTGQGKRYLAADGRERPDTGAMFGEQSWPHGTRCSVAVLEGAINGLTVERACPELPFATIDGSEPRPAHFMKLATFPEVLLLTDSDRAGDKAAEALTAGLGRHVRLTRVRLPAGRDANDVGEEALRRELWAVRRRASETS